MGATPATLTFDVVLPRPLAYSRAMRLKSEIWVKAYLRSCAGRGVPAAVVRRGDSDAGVIFIKIARLDRTADLYGPAPSGYVGDMGDRSWILLASKQPEEALEERLARESRLDHDIWILEIEDRQGRCFLDSWLAKT